MGWVERRRRDDHGACFGPSITGHFWEGTPVPGAVQRSLFSEPDELRAPIVAEAKAARAVDVVGRTQGSRSRN